MPSDTRDRLIEATIDTLAEAGIAGTSARAIGDRAGANPALIYYHFDSLEGLLAETSRLVTMERVNAYRGLFAEVDTLQELAVVARDLHEDETASGRLAMFTQLLAGSRKYPSLGPALEENFNLFVTEVTATIERLFAGSALEGALDTTELARAVSAGFVGMELVDSITGADAPNLFDSLDRLTGLADLILDAGVLPTALIRRQLRRQ